MLYASYVAFVAGTEPPPFFNEALLVFIPKGGTTPGSVEYEAVAAHFHPLTLSNSCQKLVTKAFGDSLERVATAITHLAQRGFVCGRRMFTNILETQTAMEEANSLGSAPSGMVLFDVTWLRCFLASNGHGYGPASTLWVCRSGCCAGCVLYTRRHG